MKAGAIALEPAVSVGPSLGCDGECGACALPVQRTCLAIVEITSRCDLGCPVCLADSGRNGRDHDLAQIESALATLVDNQSEAPPLQISGGEPTLHPRVVEVVDAASRLGLVKIEIDTNGLRLADEPSFAERLRDAGLSQVYLQMDGLDPDISRFIRGRDLTEHKLRAIESCARAGLQVALSVTVVAGVNDDCLWEMIRFGVDHGLSGVNFQPAVSSGRAPASLDGRCRLTPESFACAIEAQSGGELTAGDLMPSPCPGPRCGAMTYAFVRDGRLLPLGRMLSEQRLGEHMAANSDWAPLLQDLKLERQVAGCCGMNDTPASCDAADVSASYVADDLLESYDFYSIGLHAMMDTHDFDLARARRCCVHELRLDGKLVPFCLYNTTCRSRIGRQ